MEASAANAELLYHCGGLPFGLDLLDEPPNAEEGDHPAAAALRELLTGGMMETEILPESGWWLAGSDDNNASFVARTEGDPPFAWAAFEREGDTWKPAGWGQCRPQAWFDGASASSWQLDPAAGVPAAEDREFPVLVTEMACASGRSSEGRVQEAVIVYDTDVVVVSFPVEPLPGGQDCQSNPPTPVTITLDEPLGGRALVDGGAYPFRDPTEAP